ncbi:hypothetical protein [Salmonirosea aquatica]|uniref:Lipocalin-like domain-containing protein n=1 Tax=Salmonirosea aquatica TaxID=2654236 RepID=A0A7C9FZS8_9BACT|nr:hypothetical protein [Cytophagaceae bacterium SJW1-29]
MMKHLPVYALLLFVSCTLCQGQIKTDLSKATEKTETNVAATDNRANFSGVWKLNELKSEQIGNFPVCLFGGYHDHVSSKTMKIADHAGFLTVDVPSPGGVQFTRQEQLTFDDKER